MNIKGNGLSIVIPVYNEEASLEKVIKEIRESTKDIKIKKEIIAIDDGSKDKSSKILTSLKNKKWVDVVLTHDKNIGYGAALKTGINKSKYQWILIMDSDGSYPAGAIPKLINLMKDNDMVVGARVGKNIKIPKARIIPKKILQWIASILVGEKIVDLNSGMRVFRKDLAKKFWHLLPNGFSFTSTITLSGHLKSYDIKYVPIIYKKRIGRSTIKPSHFFYFLGLIIRLVVYFKPLKFFFWPGIFFMVTGASWVLYTAFANDNITDSGVLVFLLGIQTSFFGLIADLIVRTRESNQDANLTY